MCIIKLISFCLPQLGPVKEYVKMLCENQGLKFIVFAFHHVMMDAIAEELHDSKVDFIRIDGHTPNQERPVRLKDAYIQYY